MEIVIATKNKGKVKEIKEALKGIYVKVLSVDDLGLEIDVEEDGKTYAENAVKKAVEAAKKTGKIALADDSGLEIDALNGRPGINSYRFAGNDADDRERNLKILEMMKGIPHEKRGARFRCVIAITTPPFTKGGMGGLYTCEGVCEGEIAESIRGDKGFGYDPIFIPTQTPNRFIQGQGVGTSKNSKTFGELGSEIKNKISHRAKALEKAKKVIKNFRFTI